MESLTSHFIATLSYIAMGPWKVAFQNVGKEFIAPVNPRPKVTGLGGKLGLNDSTPEISKIAFPKFRRQAKRRIGHLTLLNLGLINIGAPFTEPHVFLRLNQRRSFRNKMFSHLAVHFPDSRPAAFFSVLHRFAMFKTKVLWTFGELLEKGLLGLMFVLIKARGYLAWGRLASLVVARVVVGVEAVVGRSFPPTEESRQSITGDRRGRRW